MSAEPKVQTIDGLVVSSTPLPPFRAIDLLPELAELMGDQGHTTDASMFLSAAKKLGAGKARALLPQILAGTKVTITQNGTPVPIVLNSVEAFDLAFDGRMGMIASVVAMALEVSFGDFFDGFARLAKRLKGAP